METMSFQSPLLQLMNRELLLVQFSGTYLWFPEFFHINSVGKLSVDGISKVLQRLEAKGCFDN